MDELRSAGLPSVMQPYAARAYTRRHQSRSKHGCWLGRQVQRRTTGSTWVKKPSAAMVSFAMSFDLPKVRKQ